MPTRVPTIPLALLVPILAGCARLDAPQSSAAQMQGGFYLCRLMSQGVATPGPDVRLMVQPVNPNGELPLRVEQDGWQLLAAAAGSNGRVYANAVYAWRFDRTGGVLTDIRNIETYQCAGTVAAAEPAR